MATRYRKAQHERDAAKQSAKDNRKNVTELKREIKALNAEVDRLQTILDGRPAINAGLPETYIEWSRGICQCDVNQVIGYDA